MQATTSVELAAVASGTAFPADFEQTAFSPKMSTTHAPVMGPATSERMKLLVTIMSKPPELTLEESSLIQDCFTALLGDRESITNSFELRVLLGELGLYPAEEELDMVLQAFRSKVNFSAVCRYLRFYKKEHQINAASASTNSASEKPPSSSLGASTDGKGSFQAFGSKSQLGDSDTLRAFVALGGNEDGTGEVSARVLSDLVRDFGLTIDMDGMIAAVDVHNSGVLDYADFCGMWSIPEETGARGSGCSFSVLNAASPRNASTMEPYSPAVSPARGLSAATRKQVLTALQHSGGAQESMSGWRLVRKSFSPRKQTVLHGPDGAAAGQSMLPPIASQAPAPPPPPPPRPTAPASLGPVSDEEHLVLLQFYLFPEKYENAVRRARIADAKQDGNGLPSRRGSHNASPRKSHRSPRGSRASRSRGPATRSGSHARASVTRTRGKSLKKGNKRDDDSDDEDFLGKGASAYRPPSPMILSLRNNPAYMSTQQRQAKKKPVAHCPYHGKGIQYAATAHQGEVGGGADGFNRTPPSGTW